MNNYQKIIAPGFKCLKNIILFILIHLNVVFMLQLIFFLNKNLLSLQTLRHILSN